MNLWDKISNIGVDENVPSAYLKQAQLTNRMIFLGLLFTLPYYPIFLNFESKIPLYMIAILGVLILSLNMIVRKGRHRLAAILLTLFAISYLVSISFVIGGGTGRFFLIPISIFGFTLLPDIRSGIVLFLVAMGGFFLAEFAPVLAEPIIAKDVKRGEFIFILNMVLIFVGVMYFLLQFKITNSIYQKDIIAQKEQIQDQHNELQEIHESIQDSIKYAKRIQSALLPPIADIKTHLPESFVLYKPKDIVAGDFYWLEHADNKIFFAVADCTGHGVPGAMVSVICNNALNRTVREYNIYEPGAILDKSREIVVQEFKKSTENVRDGMDIALCVIEQDPSRASGAVSIKFAGAHNPLWVVRNGEILSFRGDRQPIGKYEESKPYNEHEAQLQKGDMIYIFTDGYPDQFGHETGKKFKYKRFQDLLIEISTKPLDEQQQILDETFETWKGNLEQIDDVCVMGVRI